MTRPHRIKVESLYKHLRASLHTGGARASRLLQFTPAIINLLYPATEYPDLTDYQRAFHAEHDIRHAITALDGPAAEALGAILCLEPGLLGRTLDDRRRAAGRHFNIEPDTFSRRHEKTLLHDLTIEICRIHDNQISAGAHGQCASSARL